MKYSTNEIAVFSILSHGAMSALNEVNGQSQLNIVVNL